MTYEPWPLSGAATALLLWPTTPADEVLRLAVKELVLVGACTLTAAQMGHSRRTHEVVSLHPGSGQAPARSPLPHVYGALFGEALPQGGPLRSVLAAARARDAQLAQNCRRIALLDLEARGLMTRRRRWGVRPMMTRSDAGDSCAAYGEARLSEWHNALRRGGKAAEEAIVAVSAAPGLLLHLGPEAMSCLDFARRAAPEPAGDPRRMYDPSLGESVYWNGLDPMDGVSGLDATLDGSLDGGAGGWDGGWGDAGGGGDGGGGDGD